MSTTFDQQLSDAIKYRETGEFKQALNIFMALTKTAKARKQQSQLCAHMGLTYLGAGEVELAETCFVRAFNWAIKADSEPLMLEAKRHLARVALIKGNFTQGYAQSIELFEQAQEMGRKDLSWFAHLVFLASMHISRAEALKWLRTEIWAYKAFGVLDKNALAKKAWRMSIAFDCLTVLRPATTPLFYLGWFGANVLGSKRFVYRFREALGEC